MKRLKNERGFTILEILLILTVLGVVGAITFPKFKMMLYQSRENRTQENLADLRGAVAVYYSDNKGLFPSDDGTPETRLKQELVPDFIKEMPKVYLKHHHPDNLATVSDRITDEGNWIYKTLNGFVGVNCTHLDTKGEVIANW